VTLRHLFYRLVSAQVIPNSHVAYKRLSALTAEARRDGTFPALIDRGRAIDEYQWFTGTGDALTWLSRIYRLDRTRDQDVSLYLGVEKAGMVVQLQSWFGDLGVPVLALGGYSSQTYTDDVAAQAGDRVQRDDLNGDALLRRVVTRQLICRGVFGHDSRLDSLVPGRTGPGRGRSIPRRISRLDRARAPRCRITAPAAPG
jgi:hypothetical protein